MYGGICSSIWFMFDAKHITMTEMEILAGLINSNRPPKSTFGGYFFEPFAYEPRFQFLKELIKKY